MNAPQKERRIVNGYRFRLSILASFGVVCPPQRHSSSRFTCLNNNINRHCGASRHDGVLASSHHSSTIVHCATAGAPIGRMSAYAAPSAPSRSSDSAPAAPAGVCFSSTKGSRECSRSSTATDQHHHQNSCSWSASYDDGLQQQRFGVHHHQLLQQRGQQPPSSSAMAARCQQGTHHEPNTNNVGGGALRQSAVQQVSRPIYNLLQPVTVDRHC